MHLESPCDGLWTDADAGAAWEICWETNPDSDPWDACYAEGDGKTFSRCQIAELPAMDACYDEAYGPFGDSTLPEEESPVDDFTNPPSDRGVSVASADKSTTSSSNGGVSVASAVKATASASASTSTNDVASKGSILTEETRPKEFTLKFLDDYFNMLDRDDNGILNTHDDIYGTWKV